VVVVSPSPVLREGMRMQIHAAGGMVFEAKTLDMLKRVGKKADAVLYDVGISEAHLPNAAGAGIPFFALLAPQQRAEVPNLAARGFAGYLIKPVRQSSLERRLHSMLAGEDDVPPAPVRAMPAVRSGHALSILLAEDNPVNALLARELLRRRGHKVHEVITGEGAVAACGKGAFDLVIMDVHMPGLDGIEATRRIRTAERAAGDVRVPIYALTADALETGRTACLEAGMNGFLTKPVDPAELDAVLATIGPREAAA
jgi:CheY-like chemotaxis protein